MASYGEHQLLPTDQWATETDEGFMLNDPFSGRRLDPNTPPEFLLENSHLNDGKYFVDQGMLSEATVGVVHANGERLAGDLGGPNFEKTLANPRTGIHAVGHTIDGVQRLRDGTLFLPSGPNRALAERIDAAADTYGLASFCVGLEIDDYGDPASRTERALHNLRQKVRRELANDDAEDERSLYVESMQIVSDNLHQWYRTLRTAEQMGLLTMASQRAGGIALEKAVLVAPASQRDSTRKFKAIGMDTAEALAIGLDNITDHELWRANVMATGRIVPDEWV